MNEKDTALQLMKAARFIKNNGRVLRTINILRHTYSALSEVKYALPNVEECDYLDCINFLHSEQYIVTRNIKSKNPVDPSDCNYEDIEAKLSGKGIRLLAGKIEDDLIEV